MPVLPILPASGSQPTLRPVAGSGCHSARGRRRSFATVLVAGAMSLRDAATALRTGATSLRYRALEERGDVPGWVLVTLMTAGLVVALWTVAGPALTQVFTDAISKVTGAI